MGVHNKQRRAAKRRQRARTRPGRPDGWRAPGLAHGFARGGGQWSAGVGEQAEAMVLVLRALAEVGTDPATAGTVALRLLGPHSAVRPAVVAETVREQLTEVLAAVLAGGWTPRDLAEVVRRRLGARHVPPLAALLATEAARHPAGRVAPAWRDDLAAVGAPRAVDLATTDGLEPALGLHAVLTVLPVVPTLMPAPGEVVGAGARTHGTDGKVLGRVRSLLAKAESTEYAEEAEALSAKAQELISRYALGRLVEESDRGAGTDEVVARRLWIDPPYVVAKAMLIDAVAGANRCRSVIAEQLGCSTVLGTARDLEAVELLATSLLVQASTAMLRSGRHVDRRGTSRTRSFRRSFLLAYASRIGERLRAASQQAADQTGRAGELVPVLRRRAEQVDASCRELFPDLTSRQVSVSNGLGWAEGRAAADLALLDPHLQVREAAG